NVRSNERPETQPEPPQPVPLAGLCPPTGCSGPPSPAPSPHRRSHLPSSPLAVMNGSSHSPTAINGAPSTPNENGLDRDPLHPEHLSKRPCTMSPAQRYSPSNGLSHHYRLEDMAMAHHYRDAYRHADPRELRERPRPAAVHGARQEEVIDHRLTDREWAEEWKHLNNLLNCIMDMVEKTRRSLTVLRRCQEADREELNHWIRRYSDAEDMKKGSPPSAPSPLRPLPMPAGPEGAGSPPGSLHAPCHARPPSFQKKL
uniref:CBFA2/RUNX1 partner transcriptional co-repressor 3 n=1 Tax=Anas platyrhynchos platyrhynchos TaxID=8840 RepID=A0A493U3E7_ANAPP